LDSYKDGFDTDIKNKLATLTILHESYTNALGNLYVYLQHLPVFSHKLTINVPITNQKSSGCCWIFAGFNMLHQKMMKEYNVKNLKLLWPYLFFYNKLERPNWFLENIFKALDKDLDGHIVQYLLNDPIGNGGQWDMLAALINKYGVVSKEAYSEIFDTLTSKEIKKLLMSKLHV
ncbi:bleomycin hydrolase, partial [Coemansia erecta]